MHFTGWPASTHALVVLRPMAATDIPAWYAYLVQPVVHEPTSWNVQSPSELMHHVHGAEEATPSSNLRLAIALRTTGELAGTAGFHTVSPLNRSAEIAYDLAPAFWHRGIATHVCGVLTRWAHEHAGLLRVQATVLESNLRSAAVLARCGYQREGLLRSYRMVRGRPGDFFMHAHVVEPPAGP